MTLTQDDLQTIAGAMNRVPFIRWDRFVEDPANGKLIAYGWIDRPDAHADFVLFECVRHEDGAWAFGYTTSSADRSLEIGQLLYDDPGYGDSEDEHFLCERIEARFGELVTNRIVLS